jgi:hypothetical protein
MIRTKVLAQRFAAQAASGLGAIAIAVGVTALGAGGASAAQAVLASPAPITLNTANWSGNAGFGASSPAWFKDGFGVVHLEGAAKQTSTAGPGANTIGTLPRAARPSRNVYVIVHTFLGTYADLEVATNGNINVIDPRTPAVTDLSFVSLESVTYRKSGSGATGIALNGSNWSGSAGFGATGPAADEVGSVVHLQGAVKQTSNTGSQQNFVGTLPRADWPARNVFTIVHTFAGTYADLEIDTSGNLNLIDPFGFAVKDYSFVSLEGVSYTPTAIFNSLAPPWPGLNSANWSANAGFGSSEPGWNEDNAGVVHLQGAVTQTSLSGDTNLILTLPQVIRPSRDIYTIVHTFNGTYADLFIDSDGQVRVIAPRSPMTKDYSFVSLEGVTYHP